MLLMLAVVFAAAGRPAQGADGKEPVKKMFSKVRERGRLPAHYAPVVTEEQRQKIYDIQEEYKAKIDPLEAQVKALTKERDEKIAAVLTPEQRKKVEEAETQAKQKKAPAKSDETPPPAPATPKTAN
jgi:Spy/CpxP family protein refolding chaperone